MAKSKSKLALRAEQIAVQLNNNYDTDEYNEAMIHDVADTLQQIKLWDDISGRHDEVRYIVDNRIIIKTETIERKVRYGRGHLTVDQLVGVVAGQLGVSVDRVKIDMPIDEHGALTDRIEYQWEIEDA